MWPLLILGGAYALLARSTRRNPDWYTDKQGRHHPIRNGTGESAKAVPYDRRLGGDIDSFGLPVRKAYNVVSPSAPQSSYGTASFASRALPKPVRKEEEESPLEQAERQRLAYLKRGFAPTESAEDKERNKKPVDELVEKAKAIQTSVQNVDTKWSQQSSSKLEYLEKQLEAIKKLQVRLDGMLGDERSPYRLLAENDVNLIAKEVEVAYRVEEKKVKPSQIEQLNVPPVTPRVPIKVREGFEKTALDRLYADAKDDAGRAQKAGILWERAGAKSKLAYLEGLNKTFGKLESDFYDIVEVFPEASAYIKERKYDMNLLSQQVTDSYDEEVAFLQSIEREKQDALQAALRERERPAVAEVLEVPKPTIRKKVAADVAKLADFVTQQEELLRLAKNADNRPNKATVSKLEYLKGLTSQARTLFFDYRNLYNEVHARPLDVWKAGAIGTVGNAVAQEYETEREADSDTKREEELKVSRAKYRSAQEAAKAVADTKLPQLRALQDRADKTFDAARKIIDSVSDSTTSRLQTLTQLIAEHEGIDDQIKALVGDERGFADLTGEKRRRYNERQRMREFAKTLELKQKQEAPIKQRLISIRDSEYLTERVKKNEAFKTMRFSLIKDAATLDRLWAESKSEAEAAKVK